MTDEQTRDVWVLTTEQVEQLMACPIEIPGCVAKDGEFCESGDPGNTSEMCDHEYVTDTLCAECAQANTANPDDHDEGCSKREVLRAALARPEPAGDVWTHDELATARATGLVHYAIHVLDICINEHNQQRLAAAIAAALRDAVPEAVRAEGEIDELPTSDPPVWRPRRSEGRRSTCCGVWLHNEQCRVCKRYHD